MSRSKITTTTTTVGNDPGGVLFSLIQGEQQEFQVTLGFLSALSGYIFEAVLMEALNISGNSAIPTVLMPAGINTTLVVRVPLERGTWAAATAYSAEDVVLYNTIYYKKASGTSVINATIPTSDTTWEIYVPNKINIQFPAGLIAAWSVKPTVEAPVHGYFEVRVTEPAGGIYQRTWKPLRGIIEITFSPTDLVP